MKRICKTCKREYFHPFFFNCLSCREKRRKVGDENKRLANRLNYRADKYSAAGRVSSDEVRELKESYFGLCVYCNQPANSIDHIESLARGGSGSVDNMVTSCKRCNSSKRNKSVLMFLYHGRTKKYYLPMKGE